ncbi:MAG TPA: IS5 family transposase [Beijerinckiaceae bacterium]|nr:IS5 family transposase [Beijerinckiaceae bacterium]
MLEKVRFVVGDAAWEKVAPLLPGKASDPGATARDNRLFLEAVLWRVRTGAPWRDLPGDFGRWNSVFQRFRRWVKGRVFERVFACLSDEPDFEYALIDGTIVTAHQKASGARGGTRNQAIGRSRGGLTTKIVALVDALGNLVRFVLLPGQRHDTVGVRPLIAGVAFGALLGDKAFDVDWLRADLDTRGAVAVIPPKANRKAPINLDRDMYRWRHLIENTFAKLKEFRAVATRYDKTDTSYAATIHLAAAIIASR